MGMWQTNPLPLFNGKLGWFESNLFLVILVTAYYCIYILNIASGKRENDEPMDFFAPFLEKQKDCTQLKLGKNGAAKWLKPQNSGVFSVEASNSTWGVQSSMVSSFLPSEDYARFEGLVVQEAVGAPFRATCVDGDTCFWMVGGFEDFTYLLISISISIYSYIIPFIYHTHIYII